MIPLRKAVLLGSAAFLLVACGEKTDHESLEDVRQRLVKGEYAAATIGAKAFLLRSPDSAAARLLLGEALLKQGDARAALIELDKARAGEVDVEALAPIHARALLMNGKAVEAIKAYEGLVLKANPAMADLRLALAYAYVTAGRPDDGLKALQEVMSLAPDHSGGLLMKAKVASARRQYDEALALAQKSMRSNRENGEAHRLRADILLSVRGDLDQALKELELAIADQRHEVAARMTLVGLLVDRGRAEDAKRQMEAFKKAHPKHVASVYTETYFALQMGQLEAAKNLSDRMLREFGENAYSLQLAGTVDLRRKDLNSAAAKIKKAIGLTDAPGARLLLADVYLAMGDGPRALVALQPMLGAGSPLAGVLSRAGHAHLLMGEPAKAEAAYQEAARLKPDDNEIATVLALRALAAGHAERGFSELNAIADRDKGTAADLALVSVHLRRRQFDETLAAIDRLRKKQPLSAMPVHLRGEVLKQKGDRAAAKAAYEAALQLDPGYFASISALALLDIEVRDLESARTRLEAAIKHSPREPGAHLLQLQVLALQKASKATRDRAMAYALQTNPTDAAIRLAHIESFVAENDVPGAVQAAQSAAAALPDSPSVVDALGLAYLRTRDFRLAASTFERLATLLPNSPLPQLRLAELHERQGDSAAQRKALARAFELDPAGAEVHRRLLSLVGARKSEADFVVGLARAAQKRGSALTAASVLEGDVEVIRKRYDAALPPFRAALKRAESDAAIAGRVYHALLAQGKGAEANAFAEARLQARPQDHAFVELLGQAAFHRSDGVAAERWFRRLAKMQPNSGLAHNNLAMVLAARGQAEAVPAAERALQLLPDHPGVLDTYARALASQQRMPEAIEALKKAVSVSGGNPAFRLGLAELYVKARNKGGASAELDALEALGESFPQQAGVARLKKQLQAL